MRGHRRSLQRIVVALVVLVGIWLVLVLSLSRWLIFPRFATEPVRSAGVGVPGLQRLALEIPGGQVEAWYIPGARVSPRAPGPAVVFAHGNAELIDYWAMELLPYRRMGVSVLLPEYRGYGRSTGSPSQAAITADFVRLYDQLASRPEVDRKRIVFHGRSIGGGVVCSLARERRPAALVLQSTFTSIRAIARRYLVPGFLIRDPFDNLDFLGDYDGPVLLAHGARDTLVPHTHAEQLHAAARRSTLITYPEADHNDCPPDWPAFWAEIERFLRQAEILR